jgi:hypothetical protein
MTRALEFLDVDFLHPTSLTSIAIDSPILRRSTFQGSREVALFLLFTECSISIEGIVSLGGTLS